MPLRRQGFAKETAAMIAVARQLGSLERWGPNVSVALKRIALVGIVAAIAGMAARPYAENYLRSAFNPRTIEPCCSLAKIEHETIALFERASPSVVEITTITTNGGGSSTPGIKTGSGFFWDASGNIVTNASESPITSEAGASHAGARCRRYRSPDRRSSCSARRGRLVEP